MHLFHRAVALAVLMTMTVTPLLAAPGECRLIRGASTPEDVTDDVSVCRQDVWIHQTETKVGNVGAVQGTFPTWNTTAPTASVQSGAGGGFLSLAAFSQNVDRYDGRAATTFRGSFTGDLDNMALTLYLFSPVRQSSATQAVSLRLNVDGTTVYQTGTEAADRTPLQAGGNAVLRTDFAFTNIYKRMEQLNLPRGPERTHAVELVISQWFSVNDNAVYVYDTTEVPSGIVFNLETSGLASFTQIPVAP